jgi:tRNA-dihydrouridine synthase
MIGRGAIGNPWIFSHLDRCQVPGEMVWATMLRHLERMLSFYGPQPGLLRFRKHASRYLSPLPLSPDQRVQLFSAVTPDQFLRRVETILFCSEAGQVGESLP